MEAAGLAGGAKHPWTDDRDVYVAARQHDGDKGLQVRISSINCFKELAGIECADLYC